ncbi:MAG: hypothetical protein R3335_02005 [Anaerolineales bacterium]|nr:hypothetical protein [Anaerolineales bacterium]
MLETKVDNQEAINLVLEKRFTNGGDYWATADGKLAVGSPFSTLEALQILYELGLDTGHEAVEGAAALLLDSWRADGRYRLAPTGTLYPCHTANVTRVLCRLGFIEDHRVQASLTHLAGSQYEDGGWRCNKFAFGRGPETEFSNPGVTLFVLDAFRFSKELEQNPELARAVETLLDHWTVRAPIGPCQFGMGTLFMQVEYPFLRYNLFSYVYVLSFYPVARRDARFQEAFKALQAKLDENGQMIVERPNRKLATIPGFLKGRPSQPATSRFMEILDNLDNQ